MAQTIIQTLIYDGTLYAKPCDSGRNTETSPVVFPLGSCAHLDLYLRNRGTFEPVDIRGFEDFHAWRFSIVSGYGFGSSVLFTTTDVSLDSRSSSISIGMQGTKTEEMIAAMETRMKSVFIGELLGFEDADSSAPSFTVSFPVCIGNIRDDGTPTTPVSGTPAVLYESQSLTAEQKAQARSNIGVTQPNVVRINATWDSLQRAWIASLIGVPTGVLLDVHLGITAESASPYKFFLTPPSNAPFQFILHIGESIQGGNLELSLMNAGRILSVHDISMDTPIHSIIAVPTDDIPSSFVIMDNGIN